MPYAHILEINAKEWFQQSTGNSYFSAVIILDDEFVCELPFQYGYGDHYVDMAFQELEKSFNNLFTGITRNYRTWCANNNIKVITNKQENCKKRDL